MSMENVTYSVAQNGAEIIPGFEGKAIRAVLIVVTSWANVKVTLLSDAGGDAERPLTAPLFLGGGQPLLLRLGRRHALLSDAGKSLGVTTVYESTVAPLTVTIWFERVPA